MCSTNIHNTRPRGCLGWCRLWCSYFPCLIALGLITLNLLPYHFCFLRQLAIACAAGRASWLYYDYCTTMLLFAEAMVFGCYFMAVATAPGYVAHEPWSQAPAHGSRRFSENPCEVYDLDRFGKMRFCNRCSQFKPDHAHHCQLCGRCIYRMDHHCPWINNCVGRENGKYFLLFVGYIPVGAFHIVLTTLYSCVYHFPKFFATALHDESLVSSMVMVLSMVFSAAMGICFAAFAGHFLSLAWSGETSVSQFVASKKSVEEREAMRKRSMMEKEHHLFDLFGAQTKWWQMILPFRPDHDSRSAPAGYAARYGGGATLLLESEI